VFSYFRSVQKRILVSSFTSKFWFQSVYFKDYKWLHFHNGNCYRSLWQSQLVQTPLQKRVLMQLAPVLVWVARLAYAKRKQREGRGKNNDNKKNAGLRHKVF
jgi:hypothetical protein